ncbi:MAG: hypothetical protein JSR81_04370 [Proteobacteria bacterium]|nr:hypothetical protein [Pseudomonadota bacterium]
MAVLSEFSACEAESEAVSDPRERSCREFPPAARSLLVTMIESEIIPRLLLAHTDRTMRTTAASIANFGDAHAVAELFLVMDSADIVRRLQTVVDSGVTREQIYLQLLAPVARTLSIFWEEGRCSLDDVARGLYCVGQVLREMHMDHGASDPH